MEVEILSCFDLMLSKGMNSFLFCVKSLPLSLIPQIYSSSHVGMMVMMMKKNEGRRRRKRHFMLDRG